MYNAHQFLQFEKKINRAVSNEIKDFEKIQSVDAIRATIRPIIREKVKAQEENKRLEKDKTKLEGDLVGI